MSSIKIKNFTIDNDKPFTLIAGLNVLETEETTEEVISECVSVCKELEIPYIFKASYDKANRSSVDSYRGPGIKKGMQILSDLKHKYDVPIISDVHNEEEVEVAKDVLDIIQIPAFLCRQTDLLLSAARTGRIVNIKKGQFLSGDSMKYAVEKVKGAGNNGVMLTERGSMFGYGDLVVDYRNIIAMKSFNVPVVMDVTHSLQQPNQKSGVTGGQPELIETIARAGIAVGADGIFMETHPNPGKAKSDGANMLQLDLVEDLMTRLVSLRKVINEFGE